MPFRYRFVIKIETMKDKTISSGLIYRKIRGKLSAKEEERFAAWLEAGEGHRAYYERMRELYQEEEAQGLREEGVQQAWRVLEKRIRERKRLMRRRYLVRSLAVAASVVGILCCSLFLYYRINKVEKPGVQVQEIVPGRYDAILEMADGSTYHLGEKRYSLQEETGHQINADSTLLSYLPVEHKADTSQRIVYNKLIVPRGESIRLSWRMEQGFG